MPVSAREIAAALPDHDLVSEWVNTGGGVFNLEVPFQDYSGACSDVFAYVAVSGGGEWTAGDYATVTDAVSVILYDAFTGDPFDPAAWLGVAVGTDPGDIYGESVADVVALVLAAETHARACFNYDPDGPVFGS